MACRGRITGNGWSVSVNERARSARYRWRQLVGWLRVCALLVREVSPALWQGDPGQVSAAHAPNWCVDDAWSY